MKIEHVAIWAIDLEKMKDFYMTFFGGVAGEKYVNMNTKFESYFISFDSGARLEIMTSPEIGELVTVNLKLQYQGFAHLAFGLNSRAEVDEKCYLFKEAGIVVLRGPRITGDGYYEFEMTDPEKNRIEVCALSC